MTITKNELVAQLRNGVVEVVFDKQDGSERTMNATLNEAHVPTKYQNAEVKDGNVISVWDVDNKGFRSIVVANLKTARPVTS